MRKQFPAVFILLLVYLNSTSQTLDSTKHFKYHKHKDFSLLAGYSQGKYSFADLGFSINIYGVNRHPFSFDYFISNEIKIGNKTIIAPKIGAWFAGGSAMGVNIIYYTDFENASLVFRPEIGIGFAKAKLVYGYNWQLTNKSFNGINKHLFGLTYCFRLKKIRSVAF